MHGQQQQQQQPSALLLAAPLGEDGDGGAAALADVLEGVAPQAVSFGGATASAAADNGLLTPSAALGDVAERPSAAELPPHRAIAVKDVPQSLFHDVDRYDGSPFDVPSCLLVLRQPPPPVVTLSVYFDVQLQFFCRAAGGAVQVEKLRPMIALLYERDLNGAPSVVMSRKQGKHDAIEASFAYVEDTAVLRVRIHELSKNNQNQRFKIRFLACDDKNQAYCFVDSEPVLVFSKTSIVEQHLRELASGSVKRHLDVPGCDGGARAANHSSGSSSSSGSGGGACAGSSSSSSSKRVHMSGAGELDDVRSQLRHVVEQNQRLASEMRELKSMVASLLAGRGRA